MNDPEFPRGSGTRAGLLSRGSFILVVDDEPAMLSMIESVLSKQGWTVRTASNGDDAMSIVETTKVPPVLLLCDIMMEQIDGLALTRRLLARVPRMKVIFMSAHLVEVSWWPTDMRSWPFLPKPFSNDDLLMAVREALSS
jgi:two-component system cell cycle sensor histidine kinase/response regulator CckA